MQERPGDALIVQLPPRLEGGRCVARLFRSPLLRLEQVNISATRNVERMAARTEQAALLAHQWKVAMADGAEEHGSSVAEVGCGLMRVMHRNP